MLAIKKKEAAANAANDNGQNEAVNAVEKALKPFQAVIEYRPLAELKPNGRNPRTHSKKQIQQIAAAIKAFGFLVPILVDEDGAILAGHGRLEGAKLLGLSEVPVICVRHLTSTHKRAFALADNRLAELAGWDEELLAIELKELSSLELDFEFEITGFETVDLDRLEGRHEPKARAPEIVPLVDREAPPVSVAGDLWHLGPHRLFCGSALEQESYRRLLGAEKAQMAFADPPYNVQVDGHVCGLGAVKHKSFAMASGEMSEQEFTDFLCAAMKLVTQYSADGSIAYICMDWRHMAELLAASQPIFGLPKNLCVWNKTNAGMGTFYRSKHELVFVFKVGKEPHINNFGLGERGRYRTNVWDYPGVNTFRPGRMQELEAHPTVKPLAMVVDAIKDCSKRGGIILDPFVGSGTTMLAAEKTGRVGRGIELDPHYVDVAIGRWQKLTGGTAVHADSGRAFEEEAKRRDRRAQ